MAIAPFIKGSSALLLFVGIVAVTTEFHERSHWIVARIWSPAVSIDRWRGIFAISVNFHEPYDLPPWGVRLSGSAPLIFGLSIGGVVFSLLDAFFLARVLAAAPFWIAMLLSPADWVAVFFPDRFQQFAVKNEIAGNSEMIMIFVDELRQSSLFALR